MVTESWTKKAPITIDYTKVAENLTNFPMLVDLSEIGTSHGFWSSVKSDGGDIRFTLADGTTEIPFELVTIDTGSETGECWVKIPSLSSTVDTVIYIHYGNSGASLPAVGDSNGRNAVWSNGYELVCHMAQDPSSGSMVDSTGNGNTGTSEGSMTSGDLVSGKSGNALAFDGTDDKINFGNIDITNNLTTQCWVKTTQASGPPYYLSKDSFGGGGTRAWYMQFDLANDDALFVVFNSSGQTKNYKHNNFNMNDGNWHFYAMTLATNDFRIFTEGQRVTGGNLTINGTDSTVNEIPSSTKDVVAGGPENSSATGSLDCQIDEVRISTVARSEGWLETDYNTMNSPSTFFSVGAEETGGDETAPTLSSSTPADGAVDFSHTANIVLTFDENVVKGSTGNITIKKYSDDTTIETIAIGDGTVTIDGSEVTINPVGDLVELEQYYILIDSTCFKDTSDNFYAGISSKDTLNFTTTDATAPTLSSSTPADGDVSIDLEPDIVLTFDENVVKGSTGNVTIKKYSDDTTIETIAIGDAKITISDNIVTINPATALDVQTRYYVLIDSTCFKDSYDNFYAGISSKDVLDFTTLTLAGTLSPDYDERDVAVDASPTITFNSNVTKGTGNVSVYTRENLELGSADFAGDIGEIIITKDKLSELDRQRVEGVLAWEWLGDGLSLPDDHPFKYRRPLV